MQDDNRLNPLKTWGCYFISLANLASHVTGKRFIEKDILKGWFKNWQEDDIDAESTIIDPSGVLEDFGLYADFLVKKPADYLPGKNEYEILEYFNQRTGYIHFVLGNGRGECLIDPLGASVTVKEGKVRSKRIFKLRSGK